jgi:hypothetical protein
MLKNWLCEIQVKIMDLQFWPSKTQVKDRILKMLKEEKKRKKKEKLKTLVQSNLALAYLTPTKTSL